MRSHLSVSVTNRARLKRRGTRRGRAIGQRDLRPLRLVGGAMGCGCRRRSPSPKPSFSCSDNAAKPAAVTQQNELSESISTHRFGLAKVAAQCDHQAPSCKAQGNGRAAKQQWYLALGLAREID